MSIVLAECFVSSEQGGSRIVNALILVVSLAGIFPPEVFQAETNLQLDFCELAQVVGSLCLVHALQQVRLQVCHKEGHCCSWRIFQGGCMHTDTAFTPLLQQLLV